MEERERRGRTPGGREEEARVRPGVGRRRLGRGGVAAEGGEVRGMGGRRQGRREEEGRVGGRKKLRERDKGKRGEKKRKEKKKKGRGKRKRKGVEGRICDMLKTEERGCKKAGGGKGKRQEETLGFGG